MRLDAIDLHVGPDGYLQLEVGDSQNENVYEAITDKGNSQNLIASESITAASVVHEYDQVADDTNSLLSELSPSEVKPLSSHQLMQQSEKDHNEDSLENEKENDHTNSVPNANETMKTTDNQTYDLYATTEKDMAVAAEGRTPQYINDGSSQKHTVNLKELSTKYDNYIKPAEE